MIVACIIIFGISIELLAKNQVLPGLVFLAAASAAYGVYLFMCEVKAYLQCMARQNAEMLKLRKERNEPGRKS